MIVIKISTALVDWPFLRQTPMESGEWMEYKFFVDNNEIKECDYWFIYEGLHKKESVKCPPENIYFITGEPPSIKSYNQKFLQQFSTVITSHQAIRHKDIIIQQQSLPWFVGRKVINEKNISFSHNYDELKNISKFHKTKLISLIVSNKDITSGHRKRLEFVEKIREHFGSHIDVFGRGIQSIEDKWDAIAPYKYHIVLENSIYPHYWTEKLSDTYLGGAYPFYYGDPKIHEYFPSNALTTIDINSPILAIKKIEEALKNNQYEKSIEQIANARILVLDEYNLFPSICNIIEKKQNENVKNRSNILLLPENTFNMIHEKYFLKVKDKVFRILNTKE